MDWECLRRRPDVYWPVHRISGRPHGTTAHLANGSRALYRAAYLSALGAQLQPGDCDDTPGWPDLWHILSTHAHVRASEYSASIPSFDHCLVRNLRGRCGEHRTVALRLVQRPTFFELDVLEFGAHHAPDDDLYLLRDTQHQLSEEIWESSELRRIFVCQLGPRYIAGR